MRVIIANYEKDSSIMMRDLDQLEKNGRSLYFWINESDHSMVWNDWASLQNAQWIDNLRYDQIEEFLKEYIDTEILKEIDEFGFIVRKDADYRLEELLRNGEISVTYNCGIIAYCNIEMEDKSVKDKREMRFTIYADIPFGMGDIDDQKADTWIEFMDEIQYFVNISVKGFSMKYSNVKKRGGIIYDDNNNDDDFALVINEKTGSVFYKFD